MIDERKVCIVLPAYNAERTLEPTFREISGQLADDIILVDDASTDGTLALANRLGIFAVRHDRNRGYGGNQKTCYRLALERGADIIIMLHPDYQYTPKLLLPMAAMLSSGLFDIVLGSRILGIGALSGGMPLYKYVSNRALTFVENLLLAHKLSEYHTGFRGFTRQVIEALPLENNSDDFIFDNQILAQAVYKGFAIGEISCPARYFPEASSINFTRSIVYGLGVLRTSLSFRLARLGLDQGTIFSGMRRNKG